MTKKYELTKKTRARDHRTLYQIKLLKSLYGFKEGDLGGWIESEKNLSQEGDCWVYDNAIVFGEACVFDDALVYGNAQVYGKARVFDDAWVYGNALVSGGVHVYDSAKVFGSAQAYGYAHIFGSAQVSGHAAISYTSYVFGSAKVFGSARISKGMIVGEGDPMIDGYQGYDMDGYNHLGEKKKTK